MAKSTSMDIQNLTKKEQEILDLINSNEYSIKDIAKRRGTSVQTVYYFIKKLNKKGWKISTKRLLLKNRGVVPSIFEKQKLNIWRYHALQFEIKPYYFFPRYHEFRKKQGNRCMSYSNWRVILYKTKVIIWLKAGVDFKDKERYTAVENAEHSFNKVLFEIANRYGFEYEKNKQVNIKLLKHHLAYTNPDEFDSITKDNVFVTYRGKDGKIFLQYDRSKGVKEREYVHNDTCIDDSDRIERALLDFRENNPPLNSELSAHLHTLVEAVKSNTTNTKVLLEGMKLFFRVEQPKDKDMSEQKCIMNYIY